MANVTRLTPPGAAGTCTHTRSRPSTSHTCPYTHISVLRHSHLHLRHLVTCSSSLTRHPTITSSRCSSRRWTRRLTCCSSTEQQEQQGAPWALTFDLRERETEWTEANKVCAPSSQMPAAVGAPQGSNCLCAGWRAVLQCARYTCVGIPHWSLQLLTEEWALSSCPLPSHLQLLLSHAHCTPCGPT